MALLPIAGRSRLLKVGVVALAVAGLGFFVLPNALGTGGAASHKVVKKKTFHLFPNAAFVPCLAKESDETPTVKATVKRGSRNDALTLHLKGFKPGLGFDLFTVQNSNQLANGQPDPNFTNFGLAWYQSDIEVGKTGTATVKIKTILLDQIFGFDPAASLGPTNTFHVGFWFDSPDAAAACGFAGPPTPFNGTHNAGPVAFITRPSGSTGLGPLCTKPNTSTTPATCNP